MRKIILFSILIVASIASTSCTADEIAQAQNVSSIDTGDQGGLTSNPKP